MLIEEMSHSLRSFDMTAGTGIMGEMRAAQSAALISPFSPDAIVTSSGDMERSGAS